MQCGTGKKVGSYLVSVLWGKDTPTTDTQNLAPSRKKAHVIYKVHGSSFKYFAIKYMTPRRALNER